MTTSAYMNPAPILRRMRGYFAPVARATGTPVMFDAAEEGSFVLDDPPSPWISMGWIANFSRKSLSKSSAVMTGVPAAPLEQVRESLQAEVSFDFLSWTKLTMALASGSQHMNLLSETSTATGSADGGTAVSAVVVQSGSTASSIVLNASDAALFSAGSIVAVDVDYGGETGFVGTPVAGAYVKSALSDVDYIRRVTFNVALVASVNGNVLQLAEVLPGGVPAANAKAQAVCGFVDREGGSFYQEWSALFVGEGSQGERVFYHYPRLQAVGSAEEIAKPVSNGQKNGLTSVLLHGRFTALPVTDALDGERVVCYRSYVPASMTLV